MTHEQKQNLNYWLTFAADKNAQYINRIMGLGWFDWYKTEQGFEFWQSQFDRIKSGKDITPKARKALKEMIA